MIKKILFSLLMFSSIALYSQKYKADWKSLDKRPVPEWFEDSKFGIFIHWGLYSVPSWGPTGKDVGVYDKYAEWYWNKLLNTGSKVNKNFTEFHNRAFGQDFKYQDFASMFRAELFDPVQWAELFKESGA